MIYKLYNIIKKEISLAQLISGRLCYVHIIARVVAFFIGINGTIIIISFYCASQRRLLIPVHATII